MKKWPIVMNTMKRRTRPRLRCKSKRHDTHPKDQRKRKSLKVVLLAKLQQLMMDQVRRIESMGEGSQLYRPHLMRKDWLRLRKRLV